MRVFELKDVCVFSSISDKIRWISDRFRQMSPKSSVNVDVAVFRLHCYFWSICRHRFSGTVIHTNTFTHKHCYTQTLLHTNTFTHRRFYTQTLLHTDAFTQRSFYTQKLLHTSPDNLEIATLPQFLAIEPHFVRKGGDGNPEIAMLQLSFGRSNLISCERVAPDNFKSQLYFSFWRSILISCERVAPDDFRDRNFNKVFDDRTSFRAKRLRRTTWIRNVTTQFLAIEPHFVRKGCVSCRLIGTAPRLQERNRKEGDGKRARGQEGERRRCEDEKMWRWENVKMWRCEDEKMRRGEDVRMRRCVRGCEDVKMSSCEDVRMWRWEDVKMRGCEDVEMWRWEDVKMWGCEDGKMWRWEDVKRRRCFTDPHYWKNPALRRSREKLPAVFSNRGGSV